MTKSKYLTSIEPFYYGNRLKAEIRTITNLEDNTRIYTAFLYTYGKELINQKSFFNFSSIQAQNKAYNTCYSYVQSYLNTCKY